MSSQPRSVLDIPVGSKDPRRGFLGAFLVTIFLNSFWTGVLHVQAYLLFRRFPRDPIYLKALVSILCLFQTFYFGTSLSFLYYNVIYTAKNNAPILAGRWDIYYIATHRLITTTLTQIFFVARLWAYGLHKWATVPLGVMIAGTLAVGIVENYEVWHLQLGSGLFFWSLSAWNSLIVAVDTIISISLFVLMSKRKSGFKSTNSVMRMITLYGVATGGINSVLALASLIFNQLNYFPGQFVTIALPPVITICAVLANLQVRSSLRARIPVDQSIPTPSFSLRILNGKPPRHAPPHIFQSRSTNSATTQPSTSTRSIEMKPMGADIVGGGNDTPPPVLPTIVVGGAAPQASTPLLNSSHGAHKFVSPSMGPG